MKCQNCTNKETKVTDSRVRKDGSRVRQRKCQKCNFRFKTTEILGEPTTQLPLLVLRVRKKDGRIVDFDESKLINSISIAIQKQDRLNVPLTDIVMAVKEDFNAAIDANPIDTQQIGEHILMELKKHNVLAYIRYASVYKDFKTTNDFMEFVSHITAHDPS